MRKAAMVPRSHLGGEKAMEGTLRRVGQMSPAVRSSRRTVCSLVVGELDWDGGVWGVIWRCYPMAVALARC